MTFTNKAANEMKNRILQTLSGLAYPATRDQKTTAILENLRAVSSLDESSIQRRSKAALHGILHRYEDFSISTIDKFNLRLIRSFSRDLDLPADFEVILNEKLVLEEVIDLLISRLGMFGTEDLTNWMLRYARTKVNEGESWDFRKSLVDFADILNKERNAELVQRLLSFSFDQADFESLGRQQKQLQSAFESSCRSIYLECAPYLGSHWKNKRDTDRIAAFQHAENWGLTTKNGDFFSATFHQQLTENKWGVPASLCEKLLNLESTYHQIYADFLLLELYRRNFFNMALLQYVAQQTEQRMHDEQQIRISEFNRLISQLVRGEEAPYIYERLGIRYEHFLLDEFQDTSRLQWINLIPLLHESIANNRQNLIVGDAKQSIYRFNNGLAEQFVALPAIYNPDQDARLAQLSQRFEQSGSKEKLAFNYRSAPLIVAFNNQLFKQLSANLPAEMRAFYDDLSQTSKTNLEGYVYIESLPNKLPEELAQAKVLECVREALADGYQPADICILTDTNKRGNAMAMALTSAPEQFQVLSQDSLLIAKHPAVQLLKLYLHRRAKPANETLQKRFAEAYLRYHKQFDVASFLEFIQEKEVEGKRYRQFNDRQFLRSCFHSEEAFYLPYENLYDLLLQACKVLRIDESKEPYVHHFLDVAYQFQLTRQSELLPFLDYLEAQKDKMALQMPASSEAIQIMTIHKAKGLEFPVVIVPHLDFDCSIRGTAKFLIETDDSITYAYPTEKIPVLQRFRVRELQAILLDKLNLLYVALTRPEQRLYLFNHFGKDGVGQLVHAALLQQFPQLENEPVQSHGTRSTPQSHQPATESVFYTPASLNEQLWYPSVVFRNQAPATVFQDQQFGIAFHAVMAECSESSTLEQAIENGLESGLVAREQVASLRKAALQFWHYVAENKLDQGLITQFNEQRIIAGVNELKQPDKVWVKAEEVLVFDFKTGKKQAKDLEQIVRYANLLESIFKKPVRAFLYYSQLNLFLES
ncbi:MAG: hypothetical protein RLZZ301_355 [Bacteroidota bacterium]